MLRPVLALIFIFGSAKALAVELSPVPAPPQDQLPISQDAPNYPCDQILEKLNALKQMSDQHNQAVAGFLGQVVEKMGDWYGQLQPLEGKTQIIPAGQFDSLRDGAQKISDITDKAYDNASLLATEMDRIIVSLGECLKGSHNRVTGR